MEYDVVFDSNIHNLIAEVNRLAKEGWIAPGGICAGDTAFYQAVSRTEHAKAMFDLKQQERIRSYQE